MMDKLFRSDRRLCDPDGGTSGAMRARGLKDTSSRPAKDLGGTLQPRQRRPVVFPSSGGVANMTSNPNRITVAAPGFLSEDFFQTGAAV